MPVARKQDSTLSRTTSHAPLAPGPLNLKLENHREAQPAIEAGFWKAFDESMAFIKSMPL